MGINRKRLIFRSAVSFLRLIGFYPVLMYIHGVTFNVTILDLIIILSNAKFLDKNSEKY